MRRQILGGLGLFGLVALLICGVPGCKKDGGDGAAKSEGESAKRKPVKKKGADDEPAEKPSKRKASADDDDDDDDEPKGAKKKGTSSTSGKETAGEKTADDTAPKRTGTQPLTKRAEARVFAVWVRSNPRKQVDPEASGGTTEVSVRVEPNPRKEPSVGVIEEFATATGNQWRTSAWMAAFNASQAVGLTLVDHEFMIRAGGHIDGPSAGMLLTSTIMTLLRGDAILPNRTMTGTINPDGSAGPVGGIPQKLEGAKEKGIKIFGFPYGGRSQVNRKDGETVDLYDYAQKMGIEVREIRDLHDAYFFLTGKKLERPEPVAESEMDLDRDLHTKVRAKVLAWKSKVSGEVPLIENRLKQLPKAIQDAAGGQIREGLKAIEKGNAHEKSDQVTAAYTYFIQASAYFRIARNTMEFLDAFQKQDLNSMLNQIKSLRSVKDRLKALDMELEVIARARTIGGRVNAVRGFTASVQAGAYAMVGDDHLGTGMALLEGMKGGKVPSTPENINKAVMELMLPITYYSAADALVEVAKDALALSSEEGTELFDPKKKGFEALARGYGSAAGAALKYFEALWTEQLAEHYGVTTGKVRNALFQQEHKYLQSYYAAIFAERADRILDRKPDEINVLRLAAGAQAYVGAATLVNMYYSLGARRKKDGTIDLGQRKALTFQLESARQKAREAASACKAGLGFIPSAARLDYQLAAALREGTDADKLDALENYWMSTFWSNLAVALSRD